MTPVLRRLAVAVLACLAVAACSSDSGTSTTTDLPEPGTPERCAANEAAGTVTYVTSFGFSASTAIIDVMTAEAEGYFDELCLDVELVPSFAPGNQGVVAAGQGQMSSASSFGEIVAGNVNGEIDLVAVAQYGKTAIEALVVPSGSPIDPADLAGTMAGTTLGIKGALPYSLRATLGSLGVDLDSFDQLLLEGFDPITHLDLGIDALPVYKSNEPNTLDQAGVDYTLIDPLDYDVPASFALLFTSRSFLDEHPTAVQDFVRAAFRGLQFAAANPEQAVEYAFDNINAAGNPQFFTTEGEGYRWLTERDIVLATTPEGEGPGLLDVDRLGAEIELLTDVGVFDTVPDWESMLDASVADGLYDGTILVWPSS